MHQISLSVSQMPVKSSSNIRQAKGSWPKPHKQRYEGRIVCSLD